MAAPSLNATMPSQPVMPCPDAPYLELSGFTWSRNRKRQLRRARAALAADGLTAVYSTWTDPAALLLIRHAIAQAHRARDHAAGRACDLDDPGTLAAWHATWAGHARTARLELSLLVITGPAGPALAAYCAGLRYPPDYQVFDSRHLGFSGYSPGVQLEARVIDRLTADPAYKRIDWMSPDHPEAIIAVTK